MSKLIWVAMAFLAGAFLPIQAGLNSKLGRAVESPLHASMFSFIVGTVGMIVYILLARQTFSWEGIREAPTYVWVGGLMGAFYVTVIILAFPRLGPGLTFGLVVGGQMIISILSEHYNVLVTQQQPISLMKIAGIVLVITGVIIIRRS